jgi:putative flippase GtrA
MVQFFRSALVGGVAAAVDFAAIYTLTTILGVHYLVSAVLAFLLGVATNYVLSVLWVFDVRTVKSPLAEFLAFSVLAIGGLGINLLILYGLTGLAGLHYIASKVIATGVGFLWNFSSRKYFLFSALPRDERPATAEACTVAVSVVE